MKLYLFGYGKMGRLVEQAAERNGHVVAGKTNRTIGYSETLLEKADVCIDFSSPECVLSHISFAAALKKPIVIGTTGWEECLETGKEMIAKSEGTALYSPNFSLGMALFSCLVRHAGLLTEQLEEYDAAGIECHHAQKKDVPSGTACRLASEFGRPLPFASIRSGYHPGKHIVALDSREDTITLQHEARSRDGFAAGAIKAASWLINKKGWYGFDDIFGTLDSVNHSVSR